MTWMMDMTPNKFHTIISHKTDLIYHVDEVNCHRNLVSSLMVQVARSPNDPRKSEVQSQESADSNIGHSTDVLNRVAQVKP
jgi:hypothetical protein